MVEVFCDKWFDTEESSSVIEAVYYSTEERKLFVQLVPRGDDPGVLAGYSNVSPEIYHAFEALNKNRLKNGDQTASVGRYWNQWIKPYLIGLDTKNVEILTQDDLDRREQLKTLFEKSEGVFTRDEKVWDKIDPGTVTAAGTVKVADATILPVDPPKMTYGFAVFFEDGEDESSLAVKATDYKDAIDKFQEAIDLLGWEPVKITAVTHFFN